MVKKWIGHDTPPRAATARRPLPPATFGESPCERCSIMGRMLLAGVPFALTSPQPAQCAPLTLLELVGNIDLRRRRRGLYSTSFSRHYFTS